MKKTSRSLLVFLLVTAVVTLVCSFGNGPGAAKLQFPYKQSGFTDREAAAHLLSRFSFGATPGQVDEVVKMGVEKWFQQQLDASANDDAVEAQLAAYSSLKMSNEEIVKAFPRPAQVLQMAIKEGVIDRDSAKVDKQDKEYKEKMKAYMEQKGVQPLAELGRQLINQKIIRAAYSTNQLKEVLTDFWFNHFNVALSKGGVQQYVTSYERDVIRPNALGKFEDLLLATAKSPAMLAYLDNNKSTVSEEDMVASQQQVIKRRNAAVDQMKNENAKNLIRKNAGQGLNENYAREVMELHTLGVDGGYTQTDVTQAAKVLTGWSINPQIEYNARARKRPINTERMEKLGFVYDDNFMFAANKHDRTEKTVLGQHFSAGQGYEEGVKLIHLLATHPATAKFIARKLATRFVSDTPPQSLVDKMAQTFLSKNGDIKQVLITMVTAPEFWKKEYVREKTKSPFELAISTVRSTGARITAPFQLYNWINKMGQKIYNYQAPTGFPDRGQYWINSGSLLNRMNFGLAIAAGRIPGVSMDLLALNQNHEPESAVAALQTYTRILLPERNVDETVKRLTPLLNDPELLEKIDRAAAQTPTAKQARDEMNTDDSMANAKGNKPLQRGRQAGKKGAGRTQLLPGNATMLAQVAGIIIGSPEFQRR